MSRVDWARCDKINIVGVGRKELIFYGINFLNIEICICVYTYILQVSIFCIKDDMEQWQKDVATLSERSAARSESSPV